MKISFKNAIIALVFIVVLGGFLRLYKLGEQSFIADEYIGINIAYGYQQTGEWKFWDFNSEKLTDEVYTRANVYYWQVARIFDFMEASEYSARLVSVLWGIIGIVLVFVISYLWIGKLSPSLIAALLLAVSISALMYDRKLRMYSMFAPTYLVLSYLFYNFIEAKPKKGIKFINRISYNLGFNLNYLIPLLAVGFFSLNVHLLTINILPATGVYMIVMAIYKYRKKGEWKNKYTFFSVLSIIGVIIFSQFPAIQGTVNLTAFNWSYLSKITLDYSHEILAFAIMALGSYYLIKKEAKEGLWIVLSFLMPLLLAMFVWHRNAGHQYIYFLLPFKVILMSAGIYLIAKKFIKKFELKKNPWTFWLAVGFILLILFNFKFFFSDEGFYKDPQKWSYPNYKQAYAYYIRHRLPDDLLITRKLYYYYISGTHSNTLTYGEENKLTLDEVKQAQQDYKRIWFIATSDNFLKDGSDDYIKENFKFIETKYSNDIIGIWLWEKS